MAEQQPKADTWRERAAEIRTIAAGMRNKRARKELEELAAKWDAMAEELERHAPPPLKDRLR
jgi:hypothetical protein